MRWLLVLCFALSGTVHDARAQSHGVEHVRFWRYSVDDGLSQATARVMLQDAEGFVWIGTQDGLNRFDGHEFRVFRHDPDDGGSLPDNHVISLALGTDGTLWVGTQAGGLARFLRHAERFEKVGSAAASIAGNQVSALAVDRSGRLWVGSGRGGVQWLGPDRAVHDVASPAPDRTGVVRDLHAASDGSLWVAARGGVWRIAPDAGSATECRDDLGQPYDAWDLDPRRRGGMWVALAGRGAVALDPECRAMKRLDRATGLADDDLRAVLEDTRGRVWFGSLNGLSRIEREDGPPTTLRFDPARDDTLSSNRVQSLMEDRDGQVWIGTWLNGLSVFNPRTEEFVEARPSANDPTALPGAAVAAVRAEPDGTLWLGVLENGGLVHFDPARGMLRRYVHEQGRPDSLAHNLVTAVARDADGALWVGTVNGLDRLSTDGSSFTHFRHDPDDPGSLGGNNVQQVYLDRNGDLWIALTDGGLDRLCRGCRAFQHHANRPGDPTSIGSQAVNAVLEMRSGEFWVALRPGGLARLDRARGTFEHFRPDPAKPGSLSNDTVSSLLEDRDGQLWLGTQGGGVNRMERAADGTIRFRAYGSREGMASDAIGDLEQDDKGRIWASTTQGLSRIDPGSGRIVNYGRRDGVQSRGFFIGAKARLPDGRIALGGLRGLTLFDPDRISDEQRAISVHFTTARALGRRNGGAGPQLATWEPDPEHGSRLILKHVSDAFAAEFSALRYSDPEQVEYAYRLVGIDRDWIETDSRRRLAIYTGLPPGEFHLQVRAREHGGAWGEATGMLIRHLPSPWQTTWARVGYVLIATALFALVAVQLRGRLRERRRAERRVRESEERLKLALWGSGDELWDVDVATGVMRRANPLTHLETVPRTEVADAASMRRAVHHDDLDLFDLAVNETLTAQTEFLDVTYRVHAPGGDWRWLRSRGRVVQRGPDGKALRMVGTTEDITAFKSHELALERINQDLERRVRDRTQDITVANDNLRRTVDDLRQAQRQLVDSEKMAALGGLVAGIAHEINTPLGISVTAASHLETEARRVGELMEQGVLKRSDLDAYQQVTIESTQMILRNLQRADKLVKSFKQVAVDQSSEQRRTVNLRQYLDEILTSLHPALKKTRHEVLVECPEQLVLDTYPGAIYQVVVNLVMNSLIHGFEGVECGHIRIEARIEGEDWLLDYADDGRGMPADVREHIFDPFYTTRRGQGGSGLGMHIVFNLTNQVLRGTLRCESEPGKGARFFLRCPLDSN